MRRRVLIGVLVALAVTIFVVAGCSQRVSVEGDRYFTVMYISNGETLYTEYVSNTQRAPYKKLTSNEDYRFNGWKYKELSYNFSENVSEDMTLYADWSAVNYYIEFVCDGKTLSKQAYNVDDTDIIPPEIPQKAGWIGEWEDFELGGKNLTVNAVYTPIEYTVNFVCEGKTVGQEHYNLYDKTITPPPVPEKEFYEGSWGEFSLSGGDITVQAHYSPRKYTVEFVADGIAVDTLTYDIEHPEIAAPAVPEKEHYNGAWEEYALTGGDKTVNAVYTPRKYSVTFVADGKEVARAYYDIENTSLTRPAVPAKEGFSGEWESYSLNFEDITVNAVYTQTAPVEKPAPEEKPQDNDTDGLIYSDCADGLEVTGFKGADTQVVVPDSFQGKPVVSVAQNAFYGNDKITKITLGNNVKTVGESAFQLCTSLSEIIFGEGVEWLGKNAFTNTAIKTISLPQKLTELESYLFYNCASLREVEIPDGVTRIGKMAFSGCTSLNKVTIGKGLEMIESSAFEKCDALSYVSFADSSNWYLKSSSKTADISSLISAPEDAATVIKRYSSCVFVKKSN